MDSSEEEFWKYPTVSDWGDWLHIVLKDFFSNFAVKRALSIINRQTTGAEEKEEGQGKDSDDEKDPYSNEEYLFKASACLNLWERGIAFWT